jgi:hypothetical protein
MDGQLALIRTRKDVHTEWARWSSESWKARHDGNQLPRLPDLWSEDIRVSTFDGEVEANTVTLPPAAWPHVDRTVDGGWLVASSLGRGEENARLYSPHGSKERAMFLGDAIEHLLCSPDGTIWVGFAEEGVFNGRGHVSSGGIVQFAGDGTVLRSFNREVEDRNFPGHTRVHIDDCYAMTMNGNSVWVCPYSDFPILRLDQGTINIWANSVIGAKAIAVAQDIVAFAGGYAEEADRIPVAKLEGGASRELGGLRFGPLVYRGAGLAQGRDGILHIVSEGVWHRISATDAAAAADPTDVTPPRAAPQAFAIFAKPGGPKTS